MNGQILGIDIAKKKKTKKKSWFLICLQPTQCISIKFLNLHFHVTFVNILKLQPLSLVSCFVLILCKFILEKNLCFLCFLFLLLFRYNCLLPHPPVSCFKSPYYLQFTKLSVAFSGMFMSYIFNVCIQKPEIYFYLFYLFFKERIYFMFN